MSQTIVFVDTRVSGYPSLVSTLPAGTDVVLIDSATDGLAQIAAYLSSRSGIDAIHLISHGAPGALVLGASVIDGDNLADHADQLRRIGQALGPNADILLYGCSIAAGPDGVAFIERLAALTGADVAASDDLTGAASRGGDAVFEAATGAIEAPGAVSSQALDAWGRVLADPVVSGVGDPVSYTEQGAAIGLAPALDVNDADGGAQIVGATVLISAGFQSGDRLTLVSPNGLTSTYDAARGVLSITGTASLATYRDALRSVTFDNPTNDNPTGLMATREIGWVVSDGTGAFSLQPQATFGAGSWARSVALGDVNGDGKPDLVTANFYGNSISVLLGNGNGTFQAQVTFGTGSRPRSVALGDVNGDGKPDLGVANYASNTVSVLLGNGNGTFQAQVTFGTGIKPNGVVLGDVNGDGKPDLATANYFSDTVSVLLGNGNGTFQAQGTFGTGSSPNGLVLGDVNGDGKPDLATANYLSDNVSVLLGNGNGSFGAQATFAVGDRAYHVALGDVNGDGKPDLAVANYASDSVSVLLGNGNGTFQSQATFGTGDGPDSVELGDVNGDGKPDLVTANFRADNVAVLLGNGNGTFLAPATFGAGDAPPHAALGDVSGDGRLDVVTANREAGTVSVLLNDSTGLSAVQNTTVNVTAVNDTPVNTVPAGPFTLAEDSGPIAITGLSFFDADAGTQTTSVTLDALNGTITVRTDVPGGVDRFEVEGNGTSSVTLTCSQADVNATLAALNGVIYRSDPDFQGTDTFTITSNDNGHTGDDPGGFDPSSEEDSDSFDIEVSSVNDAPVVLSSDGRFIHDFGVFAGAPDVADAFVFQADGSIVASGYAIGSFADPDFAAVRLDPDGRLDPTFGGGGQVLTDDGAFERAFAVGVDALGRIVLAGTTADVDFSDPPAKFAVARYTDTGTPDATFAGGLAETSPGGGFNSAFALAILPNDNVLAAGTADGDFALVQYAAADGALVGSFGTGGIVITDLGSDFDEIDAVAVLPGGKILAAGFGGFGADGDFAIVRYNADGSLDDGSVDDTDPGDSFGSSDGTVFVDFGALSGVPGFFSEDSAYAMTVDADGKILVAGSTDARGDTEFALVRLNADGSLDDGTVDDSTSGDAFGTDGFVVTTFGAGTFSEIYGIAVQSDGKIVVGGVTFAPGSFDGDVALARYNADGTLDDDGPGDSTPGDAFGVGGRVVTDFGRDDAAYALRLDADGKIVIAGVGGPGFGDMILARYDELGVLDKSFNTTTFTEGGAAVLLDGSIAALDVDLNDLGTAEGAVVTVQRAGGANTADVYSATGDLSSISAPSGNLAYFGDTIGTYTNGGGTLTLTFDSNSFESDPTDVLRLIAYRNTSDAPPASVEMQITFDDGNTGDQGSGGDLSTSATRSIHIAGVNDAPTLATSGGATIFTEGANVASSPVAIDSGFTVDDVDSATLASATVSITGNFQSGEDVLAFTNNSAATFGNVGSSYDAGTGVLTLTSTGATATLAQWQAALRAVTYTDTSNTPNTASRTVSFLVNDGALDSIAGTKTVDVGAVNDAPVNTAPPVQVVDVSNGRVFDTAHGNRISVQDVDALPGTDNVQLTLHVGHGTLDIRTDVVNGIVAGDVTGDTTDTLVITATQNKINATLAASNALTYAGDASYTGGDELTVTTDDLGASGADPGLTGTATSEADTDMVALVKPVLTIRHDPTGTFERLNFAGTGYTAFHDFGAGTAWQVAGVRGDFDGDGQQDVVLRNGATGTVEIMLMDQLDYTGVADKAIGTDWDVAGTRGDFNGDGKSDLLLRNSTTGTLEIMLMNGLDYSAVADRAAGTAWRVIESRGDFDGDGRSDLLLRNDGAGIYEILLMDGTDYTAARDFAPGADWQVVAANGDFNGDHKSDLVLRHAPSGTLQLLQMDGTDYADAHNIGTGSSDWVFDSASHDFNGDGKSDLALRHTPTGTVELMQMNGLDYDAVLDRSFGPGWKVIDLGMDFNGDGKSDLVTRNDSTGDVKVTLMNGLSYGAFHDFPLGTDWQVIAS